MLNVALPVELEQALETRLRDHRPADLRRAVDSLSERYRGTRTGGPLIGEDIEAAAYAAYRMPATFAAISAALHYTTQRLPDWAPDTLLDVGAGTGSGLWASARQWDSGFRATMIDRADIMIRLGQELASHVGDLRVTGATWHVAELDVLGASATYDLVLASYVTNELAAERRPEAVAALWKAAGELLVIVEPGTPAGFEAVRQAREQLIAAGAHIVAPCPHADVCPMGAGDWCHFAVRLPRTRLHREVKPGELAYEDEKFSYVVASRSPVAPAESRILRHPIHRRGHIELVLCGDDGLSRRTATRRKDRDAFRYARRAHWGDEFPY